MMPYKAKKGRNMRNKKLSVKHTSTPLHDHKGNCSLPSFKDISAVRVLRRTMNFSSSIEASIVSKPRKKKRGIKSSKASKKKSVHSKRDHVKKLTKDASLKLKHHARSESPLLLSNRSSNYDLHSQSRTSGSLNKSYLSDGTALVDTGNEIQQPNFGAERGNVDELIDISECHFPNNAENIRKSEVLKPKCIQSSSTDRKDSSKRDSRLLGLSSIMTQSVDDRLSSYEAVDSSNDCDRNVSSFMIGWSRKNKVLAAPAATENVSCGTELTNGHNLSKIPPVPVVTSLKTVADVEENDREFRELSLIKKKSHAKTSSAQDHSELICSKTKIGNIVSTARAKGCFGTAYDGCSRKSRGKAALTEDNGGLICSKTKTGDIVSTAGAKGCFETAYVGCKEKSHGKTALTPHNKELLSKKIKTGLAESTAVPKGCFETAHSGSKKKERAKRRVKNVKKVVDSSLIATDSDTSLGRNKEIGSSFDAVNDSLTSNASKTWTDLTEMFRKPLTEQQRVKSANLIQKYKKHKADLKLRLLNGTDAYPPTSTPFDSPAIPTQKLPLLFKNMSPLKERDSNVEIANCRLTDDSLISGINVTKTYAKERDISNKKKTKTKIDRSNEKENSRWGHFSKSSKWDLRMEGYGETYDSSVLSGTDRSRSALFKTPPSSSDVPIDDILRIQYKSLKARENTEVKTRKKAEKRKKRDSKKWLKSKKLQELANHFAEISEWSICVENVGKKD